MTVTLSYKQSMDDSEIRADVARKYYGRVWIQRSPKADVPVTVVVWEATEVKRP